MVIFSIASVFAFLVYIFLGLLSVNLNKNAKLNRVFSAQCLSFAIWCFAYIFLYDKNFLNSRYYRTIDMLGAVGWCLYYEISLHFSLIITGKDNLIKSKLKYAILYTPGILMFLYKLIFLRPGADISIWNYYIYSNINLIITAAYILTGLFIIWVWGKKSNFFKERKQSGIIVNTGLTSFIIGIIFQNILPMFGVTNSFVAQIISLIWAFGIYYAVAKYKLMTLTSSYVSEYITSKIADMILILDVNDKIIYFNEQVIDKLGYKEEELNDKSYYFLFKDPVNLSGSTDENICLGNNESEVQVKVNSIAIYDKYKDFIGTLLIINDIRERKKLEKEIEERRKAESSLRNLLESTGEGFFQIDRDLIINRKFSETCIKIFNCDISEKYFPGLLYNSKSKDYEIMEDYLKNIFNKNDVYLKEYYISLLPKTAIINNKYILLKYKSIKDKEMNKVMVTITDVTNETKLKNQLKDVLLKNSESYKLIIENSMDAILLQRDGKLIFGNSGAANLLGYDNEKELEDKGVLEFIPDDYRDFMKNIRNEIKENTNSIVSYNSKVLRADGKIIDVKSKSTVIIYEGLTGILSIIQDITSNIQVEKLQKDVEKNIKLLEETRESNKTMTEHFANVSHELKTPLNIISSAVQTLSLYNKIDEGHNGLHSGYYQTILLNCYRLTKLINNLIDVTKLDSGYLVPKLSNCNIVSIIEEITSSVVPYAESNNIKLIFDTDIEEKYTACDVDKIERVMLNLLSNSIKFTNEEGEINVSLKDKEKGIVITVQDNGIGIPEDKLDFIFGRFNQVDKSFSKNKEGTGIGLYLVKSLIEMQGGTIKVESKLGAGSAFIIYLPVLKINDLIETDYAVDMDKVNIEFSDIYSK